VTGRLVDAEAALLRARDLGFLGPGPIDRQVGHALGFARAWDSCSSDPPDSLVDLGSGGGLPGLVLAAEWPGTSVVLVESMVRRARFLGVIRDELDWPNLAVEARRAEELGRDPAYRGRVALVTARGFGPPAATAECGAPLLRLGGRLIVSEPPDDRDRWPEAPLATLGLLPEGRIRAPAGYIVLRQERLAPEGFPRRVGQPTKRPLF